MGAAKERAQIKPETYRKLIERSGGRCEAYVPVKVDGNWFIRRCFAKHKVEAHHMKARSIGGSGRLRNLTLLCESCHRQTTEQHVWYARYRTLSTQPEGRREIERWNIISNIARVIKGFDDQVDKLLIMAKGKEKVILIRCFECGFLDITLGRYLKNECRNCRRQHGSGHDVTRDARNYKVQMAGWRAT